MPSSRDLQAQGASHAAEASAAAAAAAASLSFQFMGVLYVRLIRGEDMLARDRNGRSDPFVKLRLGRQKRKSSTRYNTVQPVWEEEFEFIVGQGTSRPRVTRAFARLQSGRLNRGIQRGLYGQTRG